ncbi:MAG: ATP-binding protein [Chloroflexota bacterium]
MEHISDILRRRQTPTNTSGANTDTSSSAREVTDTTCPICNGAGFIYADVKAGHPDFGRALPCRCLKTETDKEGESRLLRYSNLGALARLTFDRLNPQGKGKNPVDQEEFREAFKAAQEYAQSPRGWFVISGPSGSGKTSLAVAIANARLTLGQPALYLTVPELLERLRSAFSSDDEPRQDTFLERVRDAPFLVLDDLGVQSGTPWAKEKIDLLVNHRFVNELPTVVVTAVPIEELGDRLSTRLTNPELCHTYTIGSKQSSLSYGWGSEFTREKEMTFEKFDWKRVNLPSEKRENLKFVFDAVVGFARSPDGWLVLQGVNGCGKTHLAASIANYRYREKKPALFIVVPDFLDHLRSTFSPESAVTYDELFESVKKTPLLILDDFAEESSTPWAQEKLYQVINYRYNSRLATVVTTSKSLEEIDDRISSRLADASISTVLNITAPDYRSDHRPTLRSRKR